MTLRTQIARAPGRPAAGPSPASAGSNAQRDCCDCELAVADEARPPSAGAAWPPPMALARPQWLCMWARVPLAARNCSSYVIVQ